VDKVGVLKVLWAIYSAAPWPFVLVAGISVIAGWRGTHFLYRHRLATSKACSELANSQVIQLKDEVAEARRTIDRLKAEADTLRLEVRAHPEPPQLLPLFPETGRHGSNILSETCTEILVGHRYSIAADVRPGSEVQVLLIRPPQDNFLDQRPPWTSIHGSSMGWKTMSGGEEDLTWRLAASGVRADIQVSPKIAGTYGIRTEIDGLATVRDIKVMAPTQTIALHRG